MTILDMILSSGIVVAVVLALAHFGLMFLLKWQNSTWRIKGDPKEQPPSVLIIGAGIGGLGMAIQCHKAGISFTVIEKGTGVGGTWLTNHYPGAGCDVPSHVYSFSYEPNPSWSRKWAQQAEILAYIRSLWTKYNLLPRVRLQTEVVWAKFVDSKEGVWLVCLRGPDGKETTMFAGVVVSAVGQLSKPMFPSIPGIDSFKGISFHSSQWNDEIDFKGKTVISIGTGASAAQFVPIVAEKTKQMYVCQRTPPYLLEKLDYVHSPFVLWLFAHVPLARVLFRAWLFLIPDLAIFPAFRMGWMNNKVSSYFKTLMKKQVHAELVPSYPFGCKRMLLDSGFSAALKAPNVEVVMEAIERVTSTGIILKPSGREIHADVLIFATGFDATSFSLPRIEGKKTTLQEFWNGSPRAFWGITVPSFPNFFMLYGPNTNLGHNSIIFMLECQINYVMQAIKELTTHPHRWLDVKPEAYLSYSRKLKVALAQTVWASPECTSWYKNSDGEVVANSPVSCLTYWRKTRVLRFRDYKFSEHDSTATPSSAHASTPTTLEADDPITSDPSLSWDHLILNSPPPPAIRPSIPSPPKQRFPWYPVAVILGLGAIVVVYL